MRRFFDVLAIALVICGAVFIFVRPLRHTVTQAPAISIPLHDGATIALGSHLAQPVLLDFWASWCPPCRESLPTVRDVSAQFPGVRAIDVNEGEAPFVALSFASRLRLPSVALDADQRIGHAFDVAGLPALILIDRSGRIVRRWNGYDPQLRTDLPLALTGLGRVSQ